ncbi:MAG: glycosyltransferase family 4 protein [Shinella sp.]|nr:glycosyltransferase family 4 protein [Shinella sp.]
MNGTVVVSQLGARMHYAVPRILASEQKLGHFYTDICATKGWPSMIRRLPSSLLPSSVKRLAGRVPADVPATLTTVFPAFGLRSALKRFRVGDAAEETSHALWAGARFSQLVARRGFHGASGLYAFSGDALEQMRAAKQQGMWAAVEQMIAPRDVVERLVEAEMQRFPEWAGPPGRNPYAQIFARREKAEWELADIIVCPSEFVRQHVAANGGAPERCVVVPYGVRGLVGSGGAARLPGPLRILTVGEVGLRKGSPYVVEAAARLGDSARVRMVGPTRLPAAVRDRLAQTVELPGIIPRTAMAEQFRWADIFLLPSICEGSATAVYEALSAGLPVITTENTGSVVRDGIEGFIVPIRDPDAIVEAVQALAHDDALRARMSMNAVARAAEFTVEKYGDRLLAALAALGGRKS